MVKVKMTRYYGDETLTKSLFTIENDDGCIIFKGEAREERFKDYSESFKGCASYCIPTGTYELKITNAPLCPLAFRIVTTKAHRGRIIQTRPSSRIIYGGILVGYAKHSKNLPAYARSIDEDSSEAEAQFFLALQKSMCSTIYLKVENDTEAIKANYEERMKALKEEQEEEDFQNF